MLNKSISEKLYRALMMAFQYQINCEITPEQCKELVNFIDSHNVIEGECTWKAEMEWTDRLSNEGFWHIDTKCDWTYPEDYDATIADLGLDTIEEFVKLMGFKYCPNCGKRIRYAESEE